jgi:hypothetical protein
VTESGINLSLSGALFTTNGTVSCFLPRTVYKTLGSYNVLDLYFAGNACCVACFNVNEVTTVVSVTVSVCNTGCGNHLVLKSIGTYVIAVLILTLPVLTTSDGGGLQVLTLSTLCNNCVFSGNIEFLTKITDSSLGTVCVTGSVVVINVVSEYVIKLSKFVTLGVEVRLMSYDLGGNNFPTCPTLNDPLIVTGCLTSSRYIVLRIACIHGIVTGSFALKYRLLSYNPYATCCTLLTVGKTAVGTGSGMTKNVNYIDVSRFDR